MKFSVQTSEIKENPVTMMRRLGYHPHQGSSMSFARRLTHDEFPRLHVYMNDQGSSLEVSIHLDQKGACHDGQTAHSGEYDGQILEDEKRRIIEQLKN